MTSITKLSNGITVVMEKMPYLKSASFGVWVRVGSANEDESNNGIAHMIEHMMFKGTKNRSAKQIADEMSRIGGNMNAFTSKECTSYYVTTLGEHLPMAIKIIADMLNNSLIDEKALKKEKSVIIEEIDMYQDSPEDLVHEILQQRIWRGHPLGYMISGKKKIVRKVSREQIIDFMNTYYTGENIVISIAGNFNENEILALVEEEFGAVKSKTTVKIMSTDKPSYHKVTIKKEKDIEQLHVNIAFNGMSYLSDERFTLSIFNTVLGGSINSRLFQKIRRCGTYICYLLIWKLLQRYRTVSYICAMNPNQKDAVINKIYNIVKSLKKNGITEDELTMAKEQIKTELILGNEGARNRMNSNGKSMLNRGRVVSLDELTEGIDKVGLDDIRDFANKYMDLSNSSISFVGNIK